ncbi:MAG: hypothetical protein QNJ62_06125 [Methyloceanibacter sp.]|nr:hypothetical protein [Methyloceanibacter sp.]
MWDFVTGRNIKRTRTQHICKQCGKPIEAGSPARYLSGKYDGEFQSSYEHVECHAAWQAFRELCGFYGYEETPWLWDDYELRYDHQDWLKENHPIVYNRLFPASVDHPAPLHPTSVGA